MIVKISVITVCLNSANTIADTLRSVAVQSYKNVEHVVVDGASIDNTLSLVHAHCSHLVKVISEPDDGIYDAMNKGFLHSSGEIVAFLNSDDTYYNSNVLAEVADAFEQHNVDYVYGDLLMINKKGSIVRNWKAGAVPAHGLTGTQIPHPVLFIRRSVLARIEPVFDTSYHIAADLKQQLIMVNLLKAKGIYIRKPLARMTIGGTSTNGIKSSLSGMIESRRAYDDLFGRGGTIFTIKKVLSKIPSIRGFPFSFKVF